MSHVYNTSAGALLAPRMVPLEHLVDSGWRSHTRISCGLISRHPLVHSVRVRRSTHRHPISQWWPWAIGTYVAGRAVSMPVKHAACGVLRSGPAVPSHVQHHPLPVVPVVSWSILLYALLAFPWAMGVFLRRVVCHPCPSVVQPIPLHSGCDSCPQRLLHSWFVYDVASPSRCSHTVPSVQSMHPP